MCAISAYSFDKVGEDEHCGSKQVTCALDRKLICFKLGLLMLLLLLLLLLMMMMMMTCLTEFHCIYSV